MTYKYEYLNNMQDLLDTLANTEEESIDFLASKFAETIKNGNIIHVFGTGHSHMAGIELFGRAGGLANVNAMLDPDALTSNGARRSAAMEQVSGVADVIYDSYVISPGDIMIIISNSGRNHVPIEMAMRARKEGVYSIALTNLEQSKQTTSRHPSGKKLYEITDFVLDSHVPHADATMTIGNVKTGPASTISNVLLLNTIVSESLKQLEAQGESLPVLQSQNVDGFDNDALYALYEDRVKHY